MLQEKKKLPRNNLSESDKVAIYYFTKREDIVITKADKGGAAAIMDVDEYISKANQQLTDGNFYRKIQLENIVTLSTTPSKVLKNKSYYPLQLPKNLLQTTSEHHNFIFYQKYVN